MRWIRVGHEQFFLDNLDLIDGVIGLICRRYRLPPAEADDFRSLAHLKLIDDDYEVLRRFERRSSLRTYLTVVLQRLFLDDRVSKWGKWRPSSEAKRLGPMAQHLERLLNRERLSFDEACEVLRTSHGVTEPPEVLRDIARRLPPRLDRTSAPGADVALVTDNGPLPDRHVARIELRDRARQAQSALAEALGTLDPQDRLIVTLRFENGICIVTIARALGLGQKPLYRRLEQILAVLRRSLEARGLGREMIDELLDESWSDLVDQVPPQAPARSLT